ncbi:MAG: hypothetical protein M0T86_00710 [Betaproteobacteria bacterium]|nr:hypothetical protein [Betaproteobacteria bacterium]
MKSIKVTDVGAIKNELNKYKKGKKLDIQTFNQAARLAWLGKIVMSPLDPEDSECRAWLVYAQPLQGMEASFVDIDDSLYELIHIVDAEQGQYLADIMRAGLTARAEELDALNRRDFYFGKFFRAGNAAAGESSSGN